MGGVSFTVFCGMLPRICRVSSCENRLRSDNKTGVCVLHRNLWGSCKRCLTRCDWRSNYCKRCNSNLKKRDAEFMITCWADGCDRRVRSKSGYCREHWLAGSICKAPGCTVKVVRTCKLGYCRSHDFLASRIRYANRKNRGISNG